MLYLTDSDATGSGGNTLRQSKVILIFLINSIQESAFAEDTVE